ncbi:MAG: zinc-dependent metalloprotease [Chitinophagaceae bacterium]
MNLHRKLLRLLIIYPLIGCLFLSQLSAQNRPTQPPASTTTNPNTQLPVMPPVNRGGPRPYKDVITDKAKTDDGLFKVHRVDDKYYFELPDSLMSRDILVVNRISKAAAGMRNFFFGYAGDMIGSNVIRFEKGPNNKVFMKKMSYDEMSRDTSMPMYRAVTNSNVQPIVASFDIAALAKDSAGSVIDVTSYIGSDNDVLNFAPNARNIFRVGSFQSDKSYILGVKSYPMNVEIKTVKTYTQGGGMSIPGLPTLGAAPSGTLYTLELNSSMVILPAQPMQQRLYDPRVGFFSRSYTDFDANPQGVKDVSMVIRWRLEPKNNADAEKYKRGELVEPKKPIIFYIDPATPKKWVPFLIQGVNDWQVAFEKAGWKNAISARIAPNWMEDSTYGLEDARYSAIVYKPSDVANASGPNVHDPRSGEILESHINWYHNVMEVLRNWYFIQTAAIDTTARRMQFSDELMGQLIRFVSSHEVGHTLGLRHNWGSSSTVPVEKLRDKAWVEANGHTPSIMDYARFNYVAQPEDKVSQAGLFPRIGEYDIWAIEWGYRWFPQFKSPEEETAYMNKWTIEKLSGNKRLWFGTESNSDDPRSQNEDLGDNAMKASGYGIRNLQRIVPNLMTWTRVDNEDYTNLNNLYNEVVGQYGRYMGHVSKNIGGIYETPKSVEQNGAVYEFVPKNTQKEAIDFLQKQLFTTPTWLINSDVMSRTGQNAVSVIGARQEAVLSRLLSNSTFSKLIQAEAANSASAYTMSDMMNDLKQGIWSELATKKPIDVYRRNLQKSFVERVGAIVNPPAPAGASTFGGITISFGPSIDAKKSDIISVLKGTLRQLKTDITTALPAVQDRMTRYHLQDVSERITRILDPK